MEKLEKGKKTMFGLKNIHLFGQFIARKILWKKFKGEAL